MDNASVFLYIEASDYSLKNRINFENVLEIIGHDSKGFKKYRGGWSPEGFSGISFEFIFKEILKVLPKIEENLLVIKGQSLTR